MVMIRSFGRELFIYLLSFVYIFFNILIESSADKRRLDNNSPTKSVVRNKTYSDHGQTLIKKLKKTFKLIKQDLFQRNLLTMSPGGPCLNENNKRVSKRF